MKKKSDVIMLILIVAIVFGGLFLMRNKRLDSERTPVIQLSE
jgi:uncharacterized protein YxeA